MTGSQGTLVQQWGARATVALAALVLLLHLAVVEDGAEAPGAPQKLPAVGRRRAAWPLPAR